MSAVTLERLADALEAARTRCPELPVLAIRWMHLGHPLHEMQGALLQGTPRAPDLVRRASQCVLYAVYLSIRLLALRWLVRREVAALKRQPFDLIARTWCLETGRSHDDRDFYYGDLQHRLARRNVRMLLLCGDVSGRLRSAFARGQVSVAPPAQIPELCLVPPFAPFHLMANQLATSWRLGRLRRKEQDPLIREILALAGRECLAPDTALTALACWVAHAATRLWRPKAVVTFHEGRAWECCLWRGVKAADPTCQTVGYQHTVLLPLNRALLQASAQGQADTQPDVVLCLGPRTQAMLRPSHGRSQLVVFGTFRQLPTAEPLRDVPRPPNRMVLVVPESGLIADTQALFQFTMDAARALPEYRFVFRCHPIMPFDRLRPLLGDSPEAVPNVEISETASIADDFARCSTVLYRGSSSVLYAVLHGLKPVYVRVAHLPDGDPLFELDGWRERVSSPDELAQVLRRYAAVSEEDALEPWRDAASYVERYTTAVSDASLEAFLAAVGVPSDGGAPCAV